jgi:hypothetical protein
MRDASYVTKNYQANGGADWEVGGVLNVNSGGTLTLEAGSTLVLNGSATIGAGQYLFESNAAGIVAGTTRTRAGATVLAGEISRIDTATAPAAGSSLGDGVSLPADVSGMDMFIWNNTAFLVQLYAAGTDTINGVAGATGVIMPPNSCYLVASAAAGAWIVEGLGAGTSGSFPTVSAVDSMTATVGGAQAGTALKASLNRFTGVASAGDSAQLPVSAAGIQITVANAHAANSMNVFPQTGDKTNALAVNAAFVVPAGKTCQFSCMGAGTWHTVLSA